MIKAVFQGRKAANLCLLLLVLLSFSVLSASEASHAPAAELTPAQHTQPADSVHSVASTVEQPGQQTASGLEIEHGPGLFDIDLTILASQTINFFVLLFVLKRFLFIPIGNIIEERRRNLNQIKTLTVAEHQKALDYKQEYEKHLDNLEAELYELRQKAILETEGKVAEIIQEARKRAEEIIEHGEMELFMERQSAWARIREEVVQLTLMAAEKVVEESLDDRIHRKLIESTIEKLSNDLPDYKAPQ